MSEEFDKEAEREKLRKKYEKDKTKRKETEQMSELLLKGATMTNAHCSDCGDPIFRYDDQEFCPTCEKPVDRGDAAEDEGEEIPDSDAETAEDDNIEVTTPSDGARVSFGGDQQPDDSAETAGGNADTGSTGGTAVPPKHGAGGSPRDDTGGKANPETREVPGVDPRGDDVATARESLVRTLAYFSEQAERTEDPRQAQASLAAAREAAEALAALRR